MKMKKNFIFIFLFLFSFSLVIAQDQVYESYGTSDHTYRLDTTFYDPSSNAVLNYATRSIENPRYLPLVSDLDNDNVSEIIVNDGQWIKIYSYSGSLINIEADLDSNHSSISNIEIIDIDSDGYKDIVYTPNVVSSGQNMNMYKISYNGSDYERSTICTGPSGYGGEDSVLGCDRENNICLVQYASSDLSFNKAMSVIAFNSSDCGDYTLIWSNSGDHDDFYCPPFYKSMAIEDYDLDGVNEFIISAFHIDDNHRYGKLFYFYVDSNLDSFLEDYTSIDLGWYSMANENSRCSGASLSYENISTYITPPIVFDIDGLSGNGLETAYGVNVYSDEVKLYTYKADGSFLDDYPELSSVDNVKMMGNIFKAKVFSNSMDDFCVVLYRNDNNTHILCGSEQTGIFEFEFKLFIPDDDYDTETILDYGTYDYSLATHSVQAIDTLQSGFDLDEISVSGQILGLEYGFLTDTFYPIFKSEKGYEASTIFLDYENSSYSDMIFLTDGNLWYGDDGYSNQGCGDNPYAGCIYSIYYNPCNEVAWKENTTVEIRVRAGDYSEDNDLVSVNVTLYKGTDNEMSSGFDSYLPQDSTHTFTFTANETITNGIIEIQARDNNKPSSVQSINNTFSVALNGIEFNDQYCTRYYEVYTRNGTEKQGQLTNETVIGEGYATGDDSISQAINNFSVEFNIPPILLIIIFMIIGSMYLWIDGAGDGLMRIGVIIAFNVFAIVVGVITGVMGFGYILFFVLMGVLVVAVIFRKIVSHEGGGLGG